MKKNFFFIFAILFIVLTACEYVEFVPPTQTTTNENSSVRIKSAAGFNSDLGTVYVQKDLSTLMKVESTITNNPIDSAVWTIGIIKYKGMEILHKFTALGENYMTVFVTFRDKTTETKTFMVYSVLDISTADPVRCFTTRNNDNSWKVLILISKERLRYATDTTYYYNGLISNWEKKIVPFANKNYVIDALGKPQVAKSPGKYIGVEVNLSVTGEYNVALIYDQSLWADLSGSNFIRKENPGLAWFYFDANTGTISQKGDNSTAENLPGKVGDSYFRSEQIGDEATGKAILYFKLDGNYSTMAFAVRELDGGVYSAPIALSAVSYFPEWGKIEVPRSELLRKVSGFRYGPNISSPTVYSRNMGYSFSYSEYFKNIRVMLLKI